MNASAISTAILLACLGEFESGNDDHKIGRAGEVSRYQIRPEVWHDYTAMPIQEATKEDLSRYVTCKIQSTRAESFRRTHRRGPTIREWYILWNAPAQAYRGRVSKVVARRAERFANLVEDAMRASRK